MTLSRSPTTMKSMTSPPPPPRTTNPKACHSTANIPSSRSPTVPNNQNLKKMTFPLIFLKGSNRRLLPCLDEDQVSEHPSWMITSLYIRLRSFTESNLFRNRTHRKKVAESLSNVSLGALFSQTHANERFFFALKATLLLVQTSLFLSPIYFMLIESGYPFLTF